MKIVFLKARWKEFSLRWESPEQRPKNKIRIETEIVLRAANLYEHHGITFTRFIKSMCDLSALAPDESGIKAFASLHSQKFRRIRQGIERRAKRSNPSLTTGIDSQNIESALGERNEISETFLKQYAFLLWVSAELFLGIKFSSEIWNSEFPARWWGDASLGNRRISYKTSDKGQMGLIQVLAQKDNLSLSDYQIGVLKTLVIHRARGLMESMANEMKAKNRDFNFDEWAANAYKLR